MFVFDTSAFINGWRDHYPFETFPSVWDLIAAALDDGRVVAPREVFRELVKKDDEVAAWAKLREARFVNPSEEIQKLSGEFQLRFPKPNVRNIADPFVLAEAQIRQFTVVTYEGRSFVGPTKNWAKSMPGVCHELKLACRTLPEALGPLGLGGRF
jgi:hypothetical protein